MRHTTARGVVWSFGSSASQAILQIVSLAVLGRLLVPSEFGLVAAASLVIGFTTTIGQVGVTAALVQKPQLSQKEVGAGFVVAIVTSFILAGIVWLAIPLLTPLLGLPHNSTVLRLLVIAIPIAGFGAVPLGLLQRQLRFRTLASVDVSAFVLGVVGVSIALALLGFGAYSLVWGQLTTATVQAVGYLLRAKARPRLGRPREIAVSATELLRFGLPYSIGQIGNWIAGNGDNFIVATQLNATSLGIYSRAFQLLAAPANLIGGVADRVLFPAMSAVQHDTVRMTRAYVTSSTFVAMLTVPASIALFSSAPDLVRLLLGPGWNSVVMPLQVFAIVLPARASYRISGSFTRARGAVRGGAVRQWMYAVEVVVGCFIGSHWGVEGVAI
jgi:PST family polysaccharide transporter